MGAKVYVAAPWVDKEAAGHSAGKLRDAGHQVTSRWLELPDEANDSKDVNFKQEMALHDVEDVLNADVLVLLNTQKSEGKAVETGLAIAWMKPIILIGERSNVFHYLNIPVVPDVDGAIALLEQWEEEYKAQLAAQQAAKQEQATSNILPFPSVDELN